MKKYNMHLLSVLALSFLFVGCGSPYDSHLHEDEYSQSWLSATTRLPQRSDTPSARPEMCGFSDLAFPSIQGNYYYFAPVPGTNMLGHTIHIENVSGVPCTMHLKIRDDASIASFFRFAENKSLQLRKTSPIKASISINVLIPAEHARPQYASDLEINGSYAGTFFVPTVGP